MRKLLKKQGFVPNLLVTEKLRSYVKARPNTWINRWGVVP